tara:strand:+ start:378 stop:509 length:132 start_codon:yes stop_codon:yes gene_type:complete
MTAMELYKALSKAGIYFEVHEVSEGYRWLKFEVIEDDDEGETA